MTFAIALVLCLSGPAADDYEAAKAEVEALLADGDYEGVVHAAAAAYERTGDLRHLFAQAQAERLRGNCEEARALYAQVLAEPSKREHEGLDRLAEDGLRRCEEALASAGAPPPPTAGVPDLARASDSAGVEPAPASDSAQVEPAHASDAEGPRVSAAADSSRKWYADPAGAALLASGLVTGVVGGALHGRARVIERNATAAPDEADYAAELTDARRLVGAAIASYAIGGALLIGATIRYAIVGTRSRRRVALHPDSLRIRF